MSQCRWNDCTKPASKTLYRMATDEEREQGTISTERGASFPAIFETDVCDDCEEEAKKTYPHEKGPDYSKF
ncbi:MAG: hypothetical protein M3362_01235 [Acidobacteriota bacterium]|nr:hypothetical protein [Acidobacteriota bacterium]